MYTKLQIFLYGGVNMDQVLNYLNSNQWVYWILVIALLAIIGTFIYKFNRSDILKSLASDVLLKMEVDNCKDDGKIAEVVKKIRSLLPKTISVFVSDKLIRKIIGNVIDDIQEKLQVDERNIRIDKLKGYIEAYEVIKEDVKDNTDAISKIESRIKILNEELNKISEE